MHIQHKQQRIPFIVLSVCAIVLIGGAVFILSLRSSSPQKISSHTNATDSSKKATKKSSSFDKSLYSHTQPGSIWWIVNKHHPAGETYTPTALVKPDVTLNSAKSSEENSIREDIAPSVKALFVDAEQQGYHLLFASGYRSYQLQATYYNNYVKTSGQSEADRYSARPGTSEHQTGLAFDVSRTDRQNYLEQTFGTDPEGQWLAAHAHEYGFIIRYPENKESVTGYMYEPWHLRYVGKELAHELHTKSQTMEEFFGVTQ